MSNLSNHIGRFFQGLVDLYKMILVRLCVTVVAIVATCVYWRLAYSTPKAGDFIVFQNLWLACAYGISSILTGILFFAVFFGEDGKAKNVGIFGFFIFPFFVVICILSIIYRSSSSFFFYILPLVVAIIVFFNDWVLSDAGLKGLQDKKWISFDIAVITGILAVLILQKSIGSAVPDELVYGFGGGGAAFQLIMANVVFDPDSYQ